MAVGIRSGAMSDSRQYSSGGLNSHVLVTTLYRQFQLGFWLNLDEQNGRPGSRDNRHDRPARTAGVRFAGTRP